MSYDGFVAICHPLQYTIIMNWRECAVLAIASWMCGFILTLVHVILLLRLPFCWPQDVDHVFSEILSVLKLAYADTWIREAVVFVACVFILFGPLCLVLVSYTSILWPILKIQSREGQKENFSTCSFHLCGIGLFLVTAIVVCMILDSSQRKEKENNLSLFHSLFSPMLNSFIYSFRDARVKNALYRALQMGSV
ncbi:olfactory receptor 2A2-like [Meles meles]|uniref:olfactory receptor 2A2-like n=1 Tax=Meles meles TaxID=9662 RepID=UPI001E69FE3B|nr:olfactory receptor 2A2-like [Meles meles]